MSAGEYDLYIEQGTDWSEVFTYEQMEDPDADPDDPATVWVPIDISNWGIRSEIRDSPGGTVRARMTTENGLARIVNGPAGKWQQKLPHADTLNLPPTPPPKRWDVYGIDLGGEEVRMLEGEVGIKVTITRPPAGSGS